MIDVEVGDYEKREIDAKVVRILRDLGNPAPPLSLTDVCSLLKIDLRYYSSADPGFIDELTHRFKLLAQKTIPDFGKHLLSALSASKLDAFWIPASRRIMLDDAVPKPKHRWIESHEIAHSVTDWHKDFLLGDNNVTIDPACHATIEAEANYGAGRLLFMSDRFSQEARDLTPNFNSIKTLAKRYENSIVATFWRLIESWDPARPIFGMVSSHPRHRTIGAHDGPYPWRYFIRSTGFRAQFSNVSPAQVFTLVQSHCTFQARGPIFHAIDALENAIGERWDFELECFSTSHAVLTLGIAKSRSRAFNMA